MTMERFVLLMNMKAEELGMKNTRFFNPTGLDTEESGTELNYSTAKDLMLLSEEVLKTPLVMEILSRERYSEYGPELVSTNKLLQEMPEAVAGKTGYTEMAGGCMILISQAPKDNGYLVSIVLGTANSSSRFDESRKLTTWSEEAYKW
jgi:D-alanyl-D-alanine carboxypeptidase